jgi:hypothetical protein
MWPGREKESIFEMYNPRSLGTYLGRPDNDNREQATYHPSMQERSSLVHKSVWVSDSKLRPIIRLSVTLC